MGIKYRDSKKAEVCAKPKTFEFPANVKQIGSINHGLKIYIEDYAYSYIQKLSVKKDSKETAALLIGYQTTELTEQILVIMGAIRPPALTFSKDGQVFTDDDFNFTSRIIEKDFEGMEIVGWARVQPGYGLYLSASDIGNHYLNFTDKHSVLFLCDTEERMDCFFTWNENQDDLEEASGYFIFFEKNNGMNSMLTSLPQPEKRSTKEQKERV